MRKGESWEQAKEDGFVEGESLFEVEEAAKRGQTVMYMLSDAGQKAAWATIKPHLTKGKTLFFAHGFSVVYHDQTGVIPPKDVDVVLVAPKGSGRTVRSLYLQGRGINSSVAVHQDVSGKAEERAYGLAVALGSGYMYETTFQQGGLLGPGGRARRADGRTAGHHAGAVRGPPRKGPHAVGGLQRDGGGGHAVAVPAGGRERHGLDVRSVQHHSTDEGRSTGTRSFYEATKPVFQQLYKEVEEGRETARTLTENSKPDYAANLKKELDALDNSEMWRAGRTVRGLRPERQGDKKQQQK